MVPRPWKVSLILIGLACAAPAVGFNYVTDANGTWWGIQDAAPPRVDRFPLLPYAAAELGLSEGDAVRAVPLAPRDRH